jgi:hypothetical protein
MLHVGSLTHHYQDGKFFGWQWKFASVAMVVITETKVEGFLCFVNLYGTAKRCTQ